MIHVLLAIGILFAPATSVLADFEPPPAQRVVVDGPEHAWLTPWIAAPGVVRLAHVQQVLRDTGFYRGDIDGRRSRTLDAAIIAFHKATDRERDAEWSIADEVAAGRWRPDVPDRPEEPDRVEVDLDRQVLYLFLDGTLEAALPISSGNGRPYRHPYGYRVDAAITPEGDFTFVRHIDGLRRAPLGVLYRPWYFKGGFAVHGSPSVPAWPASHGCIRVTNRDADFLAGALEIGMPIHVWSEDTRPIAPFSLVEDAGAVVG
jgi:lipoprotein-anchoring transpeptidase ErfK/SrfK